MVATGPVPEPQPSIQHEPSLAAAPNGLPIAPAPAAPAALRPIEANNAATVQDSGVTDAAVTQPNLDARAPPPDVPCSYPIPSEALPSSEENIH